jgi:hypothetical protein
MGNLYFEQRKYPNAIKMYRMALDQIPNTARELRFKVCFTARRLHPSPWPKAHLLRVDDPPSPPPAAALGWMECVPRERLNLSLVTSRSRWVTLISRWVS